MWFCSKKDSADVIPTPTVAAIIIAVFALFIAAGAARWSWYIVDEQIRLRNDFSKLRNEQDQVNTQYEFWLKQIQTERAAIKAEAAPAPTPKK
ncbi:MAG: hypothetical protein WCT10_05080 [Patescibacteria group bacterium]|jgi:hypothetical protein